MIFKIPNPPQNNTHYTFYHLFSRICRHFSRIFALKHCLGELRAYVWGKNISVLTLSLSEENNFSKPNKTKYFSILYHLYSCYLKQVYNSFNTNVHHPHFFLIWRHQRQPELSSNLKKGSFPNLKRLCFNSGIMEKRQTMEKLRVHQIPGLPWSQPEKNGKSTSSSPMEGLLGDGEIHWDQKFSPMQIKTSENARPV